MHARVSKTTLVVSHAGRRVRHIRHLAGSGSRRLASAGLVGVVVVRAAESSPEPESSPLSAAASSSPAPVFDASQSMNTNPSKSCPVCHGTGWKPCGQCEGAGVNAEDLFAGRYKAGDACWLCAGKAKTMCGNCVDLTDTF